MLLPPTHKSLCTCLSETACKLLVRFHCSQGTVFQGYIVLPSLDGIMDTEAKTAARVTFVPSLVSFEEEMAEKFSYLTVAEIPTGDTDSRTVSHYEFENTTPTPYVSQIRMRGLAIYLLHTILYLFHMVH